MEFDSAFYELVANYCECSDSASFEQISIGGSNRTFKVLTRKNTYILKQYFRHIDDPRNRLECEYSFLSYAEKVAAGWSPRPIARDDKNSLALYEYIDGKPFFSSGLVEKNVLDAAEFFIELNRVDHRKYAVNLPLASEACFSVKAHVDLVRKRIDMLCALSPGTEVERKALEFCIKLRDVFEALAETIINEIKEFGIDPCRELTSEQWCLSPSDFGFHNALIDANGHSIFIDFEYAGWDDPAKMVGDFFSQLAIPVPLKYFQQFTEKCMSPFSDKEYFIKRSLILAPLYRIKWCCITLNVFISVNLARRVFSGSVSNENEYKFNQLEKAKSLFNTLGELKYELY